MRPAGGRSSAAFDLLSIQGAFELVGYPESLPDQYKRRRTECQPGASIFRAREVGVDSILELPKAA